MIKAHRKRWQNNDEQLLPLDWGKETYERYYIGTIPSGLRQIHRSLWRRGMDTVCQRTGTL